MGNSPSTLDEEIDIETLCAKECGQFCDNIVGKCMLKPDKVIEYIDTLLSENFQNDALTTTRKRKQTDRTITTNSTEIIARANDFAKKMVHQALPIMMAMVPPGNQKTLVLCTEVTANVETDGYKNIGDKDNVVAPIKFVRDTKLIVREDRHPWVQVEKVGGKNKKLYWVEGKNLTFNTTLQCFQESVNDLLTFTSLNTQKDARKHLLDLKRRVQRYRDIFFATLPEGTKKLGYLALGWEKIKANQDAIKQTVVSLIFYYVVLNAIIPYFALGTYLTTAAGTYKQLKCIAPLEQTLAADILSWSFDYEKMTQFVEKLPEQVKGLVSSDAIKKQLEASKTLTVKDWLELLYKKVFGDNNVQEKAIELFKKVMESIKLYLKSNQIKIAVGKAILGLDC